ncbi:MAG: hypothetical protein ACP6IS_10325 [Candidatus Asgardarchaeia archaeon]
MYKIFLVKRSIMIFGLVCLLTLTPAYVFYGGDIISPTRTSIILKDSIVNSLDNVAITEMQIDNPKYLFSWNMSIGWWSTFLSKILWSPKGYLFILFNEEVYKVSLSDFSVKHILTGACDIALSSNGSYIIFSSNTTVWLADENGVILSTILENISSHVIAASPDVKSVAFVSGTYLTIHKLDSNETINLLDLSTISSISPASLMFTPDGKAIQIFFGYEWGQSNDILYLFFLENHTLRQIPIRNEKYVEENIFNPYITIDENGDYIIYYVSAPYVQVNPSMYSYSTYGICRYSIKKNRAIMIYANRTKYNDKLSNPVPLDNGSLIFIKEPNKFYLINLNKPILLNDADSDGLADNEEFLYGTHAEMYDTDKDGLSDGVEAKVFLTDPAKEDSDGDGLSDGIEVAMYGFSANVTISPNGWLTAKLIWDNNSLFINTNSSVLGIQFNKNNLNLTVNVGGPDNTVGICYITAPKVIVDATKITVKLDNRPIQFEIEEINDYYRIRVSYHHSQHKLNVAFKAELSENEQSNQTTFEVLEFVKKNAVEIALFLLVITLIFMLIREKKKKHRER